MLKKAGLRKLLLVTALCAIALLPSVSAFARDHHDRGRHDRYHYHSGRFYRPGWFGFRFAVDVPPIGAIVDVLPFGYRTVVVRDRPYYYYNNVYYVADYRGYVVVPAPTTTNVVYAPGTSIATAANPDVLTINVPNSYGGFTPVTLTRHNDGYLGPQGEFYPGHPSVEQLRVLYGK